jgi:hypothetical protein
MSLGKILFLIFSIFPLMCFADASEPGKAVATSKSQRPEKQKKKFFASMQAGLGYQMWNEKINVSKAGVSSNGIANYAGFALLLERNWLKYRWQYGVAAAYATGKASSGGFSSVTYPDGVDRTWSAEQLTIYANYRLNTSFMGGLGLFTRYNQANWISSDPTLSIHHASPFDVSGQLMLRWSVNRSIAFTQSFIPLDFKGATMWQWTAQIVL